MGARNSYGRIPLHEAMLSGHNELLVALVQQNTQTVHERDHEGMTALHHAAITGNEIAVEQLLEAGASVVERVEDSFGLTPLERAYRIL